MMRFVEMKNSMIEQLGGTELPIVAGQRGIVRTANGNFIDLEDIVREVEEI